MNMKKYKQLPLFKSYKTENSVVSLKTDPFPHIEINYDRYKLMLPVNELRTAKRFLEGLSRDEKKAISKLINLI